MMSAFNSGNYEEFFRLWNRFIPIGIRENDREAVKLDFYIHIYFTIFNLHPMTKKSSVGVQKEFKKRKEWFRLYLDTKGKDLSETSEFLAYYALPYIGNPIDHPSFKSMFSGKWLKQIVAHTESFVSDNIMKDPKSKLQSYHAAYKKVMKEEGEESIEAAVEIDQLSEQLINERRKFLETNAHLKKVRNILLASQTKWSGFSQNLLKIAEDFYFIMEKFKVTDQVDQKWLMEKVTKLSKYKNYLMALQNEKDANTSRMDPSRVNSAVYQPRPPETAHDESIDPTAPGGNASFTDSKSGSYVTYYQNQDNLYQLKYDPSQDDRIAHGYYEGQPVEMNPDDEDQISLAPLDYNKIKMFIFHLQEEVKV